MTWPIVLAIVGIPVLWFLATALLDATRGTPVEEIATRGSEDPPAVDDPVFRRTMEALTGITLREGHVVEVLANGDETYPRLWEDLARAQRFIAMQMYYCKAGKVADRLREVLTARARAGVDVMLLVDAFGSSLDREYLDSLRAAGVRVAKFRPFRFAMLYTLHHRAHVRAVVIDGDVGYTGGFGIDDKWLGDGRGGGWRDTNVRFRGSAVAQLLATFATCWAEATGELIAGHHYWAPLGPDQPAPSHEPGKRPLPLAGLLHGTPSIGSTAAERFVALTVSGARRSLYITTAYFVADDDFRQFVRDAARRGVDVRILTAGEAGDVRSTRFAARARYEELMAAGVRVYEYEPSMIHAKTIVVDGTWCTVGTMNLDNRSMAFNNECTLMMLDPGVAERLERLFLDDLAHAEEFELEAFRRRPMWRKVMEHAAHLVSRML